MYFLHITDTIRYGYFIRAYYYRSVTPIPIYHHYTRIDAARKYHSQVIAKCMRFAIT